MNYIVSIIVGVIFTYIVYLGLCKKGFMLGFILNFLYCFVNFYLQNPEITITTFATILLITAIITILEAIANQKTQSFFGYLAYMVIIVIVIAIIIFLTKTLFHFIANPSQLLK